jgi:hypothetical protein
LVRHIKTAAVKGILQSSVNYDTKTVEHEKIGGLNRKQVSAAEKSHLNND